ncbi:MAG: DmsC/YnfH family molybdoenzyme membrane anchor subunit [Bacteroidales bacterium]
MENYFSLLFFTFTCQAAVGVILVHTILSGTGSLSRIEDSMVRMRHLITVMLIFSLATAFFHLGKPYRAVYAFNNIMKSPLSMEIASLSVLLAVSLADSWLSFRSAKNILTSALPVISVIAAIILLLTMTAVYMLPSVPAWYNAGTPLAFVLTTVSAGTAIVAIIMKSGEMKQASLLLAVASAAVMILAISSLIGKMGGDTGRAVLTGLQAVTALMAFVFVFSRFFLKEMNKSHHMTVITGVLVLISGIIARWLFFLSYDNNIL